MALYPVQEYVNGEHRDFRCSCGTDEFAHGRLRDQHDYPFNCKCGKRYNFIYGNVYEAGESDD